MRVDIAFSYIEQDCAVIIIVGSAEQKKQEFIFLAKLKPG